MPSNRTNKTSLFKSIIRLIIVLIFIKIVNLEKRLVSFENSEFHVYMCWVFIPNLISTLILFGFGDVFFDKLGLMNKDYNKKYSVYIHNKITFNNNDLDIES